MDICTANLENGLYVLYLYKTINYNTELFKVAQTRSIKKAKGIT